MANYRRSNPLLHYGILSFMVGVGILTLGSHTVLHAITEPSHTHEAHHELHCSNQPVQRHVVTFRESGVSPEEVHLTRCDELVIKNELTTTIIPALGAHTHHIGYAGFEEKPLKAGASYSFRAVEAGSFLLHDHKDDSQHTELVIK